MHHYSIRQWHEQLKNKKISSTELTQYYLKRIQQFNPELNSFITVCEEHALAQAKKADEQIAKGSMGLLTGIPIAQKDIFCSKGIKSSCGSKMLDNFISPYDATVIEKFNHAGAIMVGKLNMDEFAMGSSNEHSHYGPVKNPWDFTRTPGGSSGGSAAATAARLIPGATGTDTGGSIRQPAALCGITGLKPSYGRVSRYGMVAFASSLDQGGPMTTSAEDAAILLNTMAGHDSKDSTSVAIDTPDYTSTLTRSLSGLKIGLPKEYFAEGSDHDVEMAIQAAIDVLKKQGVEFIDISLPHTHLSAPVYYVIAPAECSSNLSRYDGVRYGYRCKDPKDLEDLYKRTRSEALGREVQRRIMIGTYVLSAGYYDAYYVKAQKIRHLIRDDFVKAFEKVDVILTPVTPTPAFKLGEKMKDPIAMYLSDIYTIAANLAGIPGIAFPGGFSNTGLPIGLQLLGNYFDEARLLNVAHQYQQLTDWHQKMPEQYR